jgi:hypothetical protein
MLALTRATALASRLSDYSSWNLLPHCTCCRVMRQIRVDRLADQVGEGTLLRDVLPRLRCQRCGDPPNAVSCQMAGDRPAGVRESQLSDRAQERAGLFR